MATTTENLNDAFAGESQAFQKYSAFAKKAEREGFANIAKLFATTAQAEKIHAEGHLKALDAIASTAENLQGAINGETYEYTEMYPPMAELASEEGHKAKTMFRFALEAEKVHADIYTRALEVARRQEAKSYELRAATSLSRNRSTRGRMFTRPCAISPTR